MAMRPDIRKRVLFFSCEPGGAEVLIPVIQLLQGHPDFEVITLGYGLALPRFARKNVVCREIAPVEIDDFSMFDEIRPDWLVTSATSLPEWDMSEKFLWHSAHLRKVPSLAFLDQWQNYVPRFSGISEQERLAYLPDYINCINEIGEQEMIEAGFPADRLVKLGHPYLSSLRCLASQVDVASVRRRLPCSGESLALFVSEPIRKYYGDSRGYDQYEALGLFFELIERGGLGMRPLIKLHPKDDVSLYSEILERHRHLQPLVVTDALDSMECILVADTVFGMTSIMLIEAYVLGKPVVSLQPNLRGEDHLVLSRHDLIPRVVDTAINATSRNALGGKRRDCKLDYEFRAAALINVLKGKP